jgi:hypothetical protein
VSCAGGGAIDLSFEPTLWEDNTLGFVGVVADAARILVPVTGLSTADRAEEESIATEFGLAFESNFEPSTAFEFCGVGTVARDFMA